MVFSSRPVKSVNFAFDAYIARLRIFFNSNSSSQNSLFSLTCLYNFSFNAWENCQLNFPVLIYFASHVKDCRADVCNTSIIHESRCLSSNMFVRGIQKWLDEVQIKSTVSPKIRVVSFAKFNITSTLFIKKMCNIVIYNKFQWKCFIQSILARNFTFPPALTSTSLPNLDFVLAEE